MKPNATVAIVIRSAAVASVAVLVGCVSQKNTGGNHPAFGRAPEQQTLSELSPPVRLPTPATQPDAPASADALEAYALGRDALIRNQKPVAIKYLTQAVEFDGGSALVWRDLGYAQAGRDDTKSAASYRHAVALDPNDADSRLQLARFAIATNKADDAVLQLRLARLTSDYADNGGLAAVIDLLLGQALEQARYRTAALECYENVLKIVDERGVDLRNRPELADVLQRPGLLVLRIADLATECGRYPRAIELYKRLQAQEPQSAGMIQLRLARAELARGNREAAARQAAEVVVRAEAATLALALFDDLYESYGGAAAAYIDLKPLTLNGEEQDTLNILRGHLLLKSNQPALAIETLHRVRSASLPLVRLTVHAFRAVNKPTLLVNELLVRATAEPQKWPVFARAWAILSQTGQPDPLTADELSVMATDPRFASAKAYAAARLYEIAGRQTSARAARHKVFAMPAATTGPSSVLKPPSTAWQYFDAAKADRAPPIEFIAADDVSNGQAIEVVLREYRDDPELLNDVAAIVLRAGQKKQILNAFDAISNDLPGDPVIASTYAQVLAADEQRSQAAGVLDKAASVAKSANELYMIASQYSAIGDEKSTERVLRKAYAFDPKNAAVCNDLGFLLTDQNRDLDFARELLNRAVAAESDNAAYLDSLGWLQYKQGDFANAVKNLLAAVSLISPPDPVVLDHAGDATYRAKQVERAADFWGRAVDAIKLRGANDPQLRLRIEQKLRQLKDKATVTVAPVAKAD